MRVLTVALVAAVVGGAHAATLGPSPYLSFADSPFFGGSFQSFYLEDFEDGAFNVPNAAISGGVVAAPDLYTDSVDADDGLIDGNGNAGHSWYSANALHSISIDFTPVNGQYPTHAGVVWTDVGFTTGPVGYGDVQFDAFGPGNVPIGSLFLPGAGDGNAAGGTAEDRFFGIVDLGGVASIQLSMPDSVDWELDHVQYGYTPEPATFCGAAALAALIIARRR